MKKVVSIVLLVVMLLSLGLVINAQPVFATTIKIEMTKTGKIVDMIGNCWQIEYTFVLHNPTNRTLYNVTISDPKMSTIIYPSGWNPILFSGTANDKVCKGFYTVTQEEMSAHTVHNEAIVSGDNKESNPTESTNDTADCDVLLPCITLDKSGIWHLTEDIISYEFLVTNTGLLPLNNIFLNDSNVTVSWPSGFTGTLAPNESVKATATYNVPNGVTHVDNTATVTGKFDDSSNTVSATSTCSLDHPTQGGILPEVPTGLLLGAGIAGIGGFVLIKRRSLFPGTR